MESASITTRTAVDAELPDVRVASRVHARVVWRRRLAKASRWLHIYGSMFSLAIVLFFAVTGITLNHQDWFAGREVTSTRQGSLDASWLRRPDGDVDRLLVVERLRASAGVAGAVADFRVEEDTADVAFKGPGYSADVVIDRATGRFEITEVRMGVAAIVNDLHKGRDTGTVWKAVIDIAAGLLVFIALTGLVLLYFAHKYRVAGVLLVAAGTAIACLFYAAFVP
jgi:hypothetical protein